MARVTVTVDDDSSDLADRLTAVEATMVDQAAQIEALQAQFDAYTADVDAALATLQAQLQAAIVAGGDPAATQAALDAFTSDMAAARTKLGDANADGDPAPPTPVEPVL